MSATAPVYGSIAELQKAYQDGSTNVKQVTQQYLAAIDALNGNLNAITAINKKALDDAQRLDVSSAEVESNRCTSSMTVVCTSSKLISHRTYHKTKEDHYSAY